MGLNDHFELFSKTKGYRGIGVNPLTTVSSFYLQSSQLRLGGLLCTGPAAILPPVRTGGSTDLTGFSPLFRPAGPPCVDASGNSGGQPFRQFPFIGATGPNFGLTGTRIAPPFTSVLGTPSGGGGNFGAASFFPGIGSVVGSILPGIVLSTGRTAATPLAQAISFPTTFTTQPSYLPDAPFINRLYGESSFTNFVAGG